MTLRSIGAVLGGFFAMAVVVMVTTAIATVAFFGRPQPGIPPRPTPAYLAVNLACALAAAIFGGYVCARLAPANPLAHAAALALLVTVMSVVSARSGQSGAPELSSWYPYAIAALAVIGVVFGSCIRHWSTG